MIPPRRSHLRLLLLAATGVLVLGALLLLDGLEAPPPAAVPADTSVTSEPRAATAGPVPATANADGQTPRPPDPGERTVVQPTQRRLSGLVRTRSRATVSNVALHFDGPERDYDARTNAHGAFTIDGVLFGNYQVMAVGPHLLTHTEFLDVTADSPNPVITIDQGLEVSGQILDDQKRPLAGVRITPWRRGPSGEELEPRGAVTTDDWGRFSLRGPADGPTFVLAELAGYAPGKCRLEPTRIVTFTLHRAPR